MQERQLSAEQQAWTATSAKGPRGVQLAGASPGVQVCRSVLSRKPICLQSSQVKRIRKGRQTSM